MVDNYGRWYEEEDYSKYPKEKWCFNDYMAVWIRQTGYEIKTTMENIIDLAEIHHRGYVEEHGCSFMSNEMSELDLYMGASIQRWAEDVQCFIEESGGLIEFDYEV